MEGIVNLTYLAHDSLPIKGLVELFQQGVQAAVNSQKHELSRVMPFDKHVNSLYMHTVKRVKKLIHVDENPKQVLQ